MQAATTRRVSRATAVADDSRNRGEPDRSRISLEQAHEVRYWTKELGVTGRELRNALAATGSRSATRVREYLKTSG